MAAVSIDLKDDAALKALISEAILGSIDAVKRDAILKAAIEHVLKPEQRHPSDAYVSPIERAFREAVVKVAQEEATRMVTSDPEVTAKIKGLIEQAAERAFADPEKLVSKIESAIRTAITGDRY